SAMDTGQGWQNFFGAYTRAPCACQGQEQSGRGRSGFSFRDRVAISRFPPGRIPGEDQTPRGRGGPVRSLKRGHTEVSVEKLLISAVVGGAPGSSQLSQRLHARRRWSSADHRQSV